MTIRDNLCSVDKYESIPIKLNFSFPIVTIGTDFAPIKSTERDADMSNYREFTFIFPISKGFSP